jgi:hypothetical protein
VRDWWLSSIILNEKKGDYDAEIPAGLKDTQTNNIFDYMLNTTDADPGCPVDGNRLTADKVSHTVGALVDHTSLWALMARPSGSTVVTGTVPTTVQ